MNPVALGYMRGVALKMRNPNLTKEDVEKVAKTMFPKAIFIFSYRDMFVKAVVVGYIQADK